MMRIAPWIVLVALTTGFSGVVFAQSPPPCQSLIDNDGDGTVDRSETYVYDEHGRRLERWITFGEIWDEARFYSYFASPDAVVPSVEIHRDSDSTADAMIEMSRSSGSDWTRYTEEFSDGDIVWTRTLTQRSPDRFDSIVTETLTGPDTTWSHIQQFDDLGRLFVEQWDDDGDGTDDRLIRYHYDDESGDISHAVIELPEQPEITGEIRYSYDERNRLVEIQIDEPEGLDRRIEYIYDFSDWLLSETTWDEAGNIIEQRSHLYDCWVALEDGRFSDASGVVFTSPENVVLELTGLTVDGPRQEEDVRAAVDQVIDYLAGGFDRFERSEARIEEASVTVNWTIDQNGDFAFESADPPWLNHPNITTLSGFLDGDLGEATGPCAVSMVFDVSHVLQPFSPSDDELELINETARQRLPGQFETSERYPGACLIVAESGARTTITYDTDGQELGREMDYDADGRVDMVTEGGVGFDCSGATRTWPWGEQEALVPSPGHLGCAILSFEAGELGYTVAVVQDELEHTIERRITLNEDDTTERTVVVSYDTDGDLFSETVDIDGDGVADVTATHTYDNFGNRITSEIDDASGIVRTMTYSYDCWSR